MNKVAVFGNAGGGKSTLSRRLAEITGLPLHVLDKIQFPSGSSEIPHEDFKHIHQEILESDRWVIDGFGSMETLWLRLDAADSLVFIDLPLYVHFWFVTKRMMTGIFSPPPGWPENSPILKSSISSYRVLWPCYKHLTPKYRKYIEQAQSSKKTYHIKSTKQMSQFLEALKDECS